LGGFLLRKKPKKAIIFLMNQANTDFKNKKVLVMGLGLLGGGIATTKWLVKHGAKVTVTDMKTKSQLAGSIKALGSAAKNVGFVLGKHNEADFRRNEVVVVNPAVPRGSKYLAVAKKNGARLENEASLFFELCRNPVIGVTGTRGKTTTANWLNHLLKGKFPHTVLTGNSSSNPMLKALDGLDGRTPVVAELSSWHLELLPVAKKSPHIAIITNIYPDHLNRYRSIADYARAKANIFRYQTKDDFLILNRRNPWTGLYLALHKKWRVKSRVIYFPAETFISRRSFEKIYGAHNYENLLAALLAAELSGVPKAILKKAVKKMPSVKFREETIYRSAKLMIVNDTTATSPDGAIAALRRFGGPELVFIAGGTDKKLVFGEWARIVNKYLKPDRLYLLDGSATRKMVLALKKQRFFGKNEPSVFTELGVLTKAVRGKVRTMNRVTVVFSPGAASFEKFKNEFDRGERFNAYSRQLISR
jgi:UDP-N-acetylmuramoylalanine--D-glutamate ligase